MPTKVRVIPLLILLMEEILHQLIWRIYHYLQGFTYLRWCRISSINSIISLSFTYCIPSTTLPSLVRRYPSRNLAFEMPKSVSFTWKFPGNETMWMFPKMVGFPNNHGVFLLKMIILRCFGGTHNFWKHPCVFVPVFHLKSCGKKVVANWSPSKIECRCTSA